MILEEVAYFCLLQGDEMDPKARRQGQEGYGSPANEVGKHLREHTRVKRCHGLCSRRSYQECHSLGDSGVVRIPRLRASDCAVHLEVAAHEDGEGDPVDEHEEDNVGETECVAGLEGQTHSELAVVGDASQGQSSHEQRERPAAHHDVGRVSA